MQALPFSVARSLARPARDVAVTPLARVLCAAVLLAAPLTSTGAQEGIAPRADDRRAAAAMAALRPRFGRPDAMISLRRHRGSGGWIRDPLPRVPRGRSVPVPPPPPAG